MVLPWGNHEFSFGYVKLKVLAGEVNARKMIWFNTSGEKYKKRK